MTVVAATPIPSPVATETATATLTATPTPAPTATPKPTLPPTATPIPPTPTPTPCATAVGIEFYRLYSYPEMMTALGCPITPQYQTWAAEERFQRGRMFWQQYPDTIHILYDRTGSFQTGIDLFIEGNPEDACPEIGGAPEGLFKPVRGFNWQWCRVPGVRDELGWALEKEMGYDAMYQGFEHGRVLQSRASHLFVFYDDGTWAYIE